MTILLRLERNVQLTVCGMISQQWLDGLLSGEIAQAQGGLTQGQLAWRETHRQIKAGASTTFPMPDRFDLVDTEEL